MLNEFIKSRLRLEISLSYFYFRTIRIKISRKISFEATGF